MIIYNDPSSTGKDKSNSGFIESYTFSIGQVLGGSYTIKIPDFQRDYAWKDEHVKELWDDLMEAIDSREPRYFLGPMVFKKEIGNVLRVIDGQQRIATLFIILSVIRRILQQNGEDKRADNIRNKYFGKEIGRTLEQLPKFYMNEKNNRYFDDFIQVDAEEEKIRRQMRGLKVKDPNFLLLQAILLIWGYLKKRQLNKSGKEFDVSTLFDIEEYIDTNVFVLMITVVDEIDAYIIFERINDRGITLNTMDLLKGYIFEKARGDFMEDAKSEWIVVNESLSNIKSNERFLNHYWNSKHGRVNKEQLFRQMRDKIKDAASAIAFVKDLSEGARLYAALNNSGDTYWNEHAPQTRENIKTLNMLDVQISFPILMAAVQTFEVDEFRKLTDILVVMAIRYNFIGEKATGVLSNTYIEIPPKIVSGDIKKSIQVFREFKSIYPKDEDFIQAFSTRVVKEADRARYLLGKLEPYPYKDDPTKLNLEHILPKSPNQEWSDAVREMGKDDLQDYIYRLGNQALTFVAFHKGAGSKGFDIKKKLIYSQENVIKFTQMLNGYPTWLKADIEDRQRKLAEKAVRVWRIED